MGGGHAASLLLGYQRLSEHNLMCMNISNKTMQPAPDLRVPSRHNEPQLLSPQVSLSITPDCKPRLLCALTPS